MIQTKTDKIGKQQIIRLVVYALNYEQSYRV